MKDIQHEKYAHLMMEVEELEEKVDELEKAGDKPGDLKAALEELAEARGKLTRVSDGCGPSRAPGA